MREHWLRKINSGIRDSLSLCLVNRHCEAEPNRELLSLELKREHLIIRGILGKKILFPACWPSTISASMIFLWNPRTTSLMPLQSLFVGSIFLSNMTGQLILSFKNENNFLSDPHKRYIFLKVQTSNTKQYIC
jgi:hypothetical protein